MAVKDPKATQYRTVRILKCESGIVVVPRCGELHRGTNEQIEWVICPPDLNFTVRFDKETGSPFEEKEFTRSNNTSGPPIDKLGEKDTFYAYSLVVDGHEPIDPGVIIWE